jgi:hypothetical protein
MWLTFPQWFAYYILHYTKLKLYNYISAPNLNHKCSRGPERKKGVFFLYWAYTPLRTQIFLELDDSTVRLVLLNFQPFIWTQKKIITFQVE